MREIGDLTPLRELTTALEQWAADDAERGQPEDATLSEVRRRLDAALAEAASPVLVVSIAEYAKLQRIDINAAYARWRRRQIPNAVKIGKRIIIPIESAAA